MVLRRIAGGLIVMCGLTALGPGAAAQTPPELPAKVKLVTEWDSIPLGHQMQVWAGVLFDMAPGWHIYWKNPGDSGEPPKIHWILPENLHSGAVQWPTPKRLGHGSVLDYGYEGQVLLMANVGGPFGSDGINMKEVSIGADVKYVVCREICIPAETHLMVKVPVGASASNGGLESLEIFRTTRANLPKSRKMLPRVSVDASGDNFVLSVGKVRTVRSATFFPEEANVIENSAPQDLTETPDGFRLTLKKSELLTRRPEKLWGVLVINGDSAYNIGTPIAW